MLKYTRAEHGVTINIHLRDQQDKMESQRSLCTFGTLLFHNYNLKYVILVKKRKNIKTRRKKKNVCSSDSFGSIPVLQVESSLIELSCSSALPVLLHFTALSLPYLQIVKIVFLGLLTYPFLQLSCFSHEVYIEHRNILLYGSDH